MKIDKPKSLAELMKLLAQAQSEGAEVKFVNAETGEEGIPPELARMLEAAGADCPDCGHHHPKPGDNSPSSDLAKHLLELAAVHAHPPKFERGQFVRYRLDVDYVKNAHGLHIVVDSISPPITTPFTHESEGSPVAYRRYDVVIATKSGNGYCKYLADSRELELFPDADKLITKSS